MDPVVQDLKQSPIVKLANQIPDDLLPQDPFIAVVPYQGPSFLDTEACLCALRKTPAGLSSGTGWQCIGNQTQGVYTTNAGKWFNTVNSNNDKIDGSVTDASNPADPSKAFQWDDASKELVPAKLETLNIYNRQCTAVNHTVFSTAFYRTNAMLQNGEIAPDAVPCYRAGAIPMKIQSAESWVDKGCNEGFLCANNTVNSLPQFCAPVTECQIARLAGITCQFNGQNIGMGPFEPVVCKQGSYCPKPGREIFICPSGSYCQPGSSKPTPCNWGSSCPEGSSFETYVLPLVILIVVDVLLIVSALSLVIRKRFFKKSQQGHGGAKKPKGMSGVTARMTGYRELDDEADVEMIPMHATYNPHHDAYAGFQAIYELASPQDARMSEVEAGFSPELKVFVESMRKATETNDFGLSFGYTDLSFQPKGSSRPILQKVTGSIKSGSLVAVMGGSGAGKSTFVNVLMGKTKNTGGSVTINDVPGKIDRYKKLIGYVPQDDIVLPELTVYENILHSAQIRLSRTWKDKDIVAHVNSVIDCLELSHVRNSMVGTVGKPVISGGQRKRVSIGMELAAAPMAIFLDEPTSGLDATAASSIMKTLKAIARLGFSVIVVIHQPRAEIFELLDDLILLGNGQLMYEGPHNEVHSFFEDAGFRFPEHGNPGDIITDIITGNGRAYKKSGDISKESLISHWEGSRQSRRMKESHRMSRVSITSIKSTKKNAARAIRRRGARRYKQFWLCLRRAMLQQGRGKTALVFETVLATLAGFLLGIASNSKKGVMFTGIYLPPFDVLSISTDFKAAPETALLTCIAIGLVSGAPGVRVFSEEMLLYRRESEAGHSRLAYFLAKLVSVFPRIILTCFHFTTVLFLLAVTVIPYYIGFLTNLTYFYSLYGLSSIIGMIVRREDSPLIATMIALIVGILCGASPQLRQTQEWNMEWLWKTSPSLYLAQIYFSELVGPYDYLYDISLAMKSTGYSVGFWGNNLAIMFGIGTAYRLVAFVALVFGGRLRI